MISATTLALYGFGMLAVASALGATIFARSPAGSITALVCVGLSLSGVFIALGAEFLAIAHILTVLSMGLVLFVSTWMLAGPDDEKRTRLSLGRTVFVGIGLVLAAATFGFVALQATGPVSGASDGLPPVAIGDARLIGFELFGSLGLPLGICALLLVAALVGASTLSRGRRG